MFYTYFCTVLSFTFYLLILILDNESRNLKNKDKVLEKDKNIIKRSNEYEKSTYYDMV